MSELEVCGAWCLGLLSDEATSAVLAVLARETLSAVGIREGVSGLGYRVGLSRLRKLERLGLVALEHPHGPPARGGAHCLTTAGNAIVAVIDAAAACEAGWTESPPAFGAAGSRALAVAADKEFQAIARALAHERLQLRLLKKLLPDMSQGTLDRRLHDRGELGLVSSIKEGREAWHSLTAAGRRMATVALYAACWEWRFGRGDKNVLRSDLAGPIHQIAPLVGVQEGLRGVCVLHEDWPTTVQGDVYLALSGGQLTPFVLPPISRRDVEARGTPEQWTRALVDGELTALHSSGDRTLLAATIEGLHRQLCA
jgi:DNA-binding HxlR family transcriptional regulator